MPPSESQSVSAESAPQTFSKEVNTSAAHGKKMTASEPKKIITKSKSKSTLEEKHNGSKKAMLKSRTLSTLKEVNNPLISSKNEMSIKPKSSAKEEINFVEKKQKKSLGKSKTNKDLKSAEISVNSLPVKSLVKSKTVVKFDNFSNSNSELKSNTVDNVDQIHRPGVGSTKATLSEPKSSNGSHDSFSAPKSGPPKSLAKSKTVAKLKSVKNISNEEPNKVLRKSKSHAQIIEVNEPVSVIVDHEKPGKQTPKMEEDKNQPLFDKKMEIPKAGACNLTCISEDVTFSDCVSEKNEQKVWSTNTLPVSTHVHKSLVKSKTVAKLKSTKGCANEESTKLLRKCRSQAQLKETNKASIVDEDRVDIDQSSFEQGIEIRTPFQPTPSKDSLVKTIEPEACPESLNLDCVTPKTVSKAHKERLKKLAFSDVSVFFFNRTQGYCSVPRDGGNTIGMDMKHSHQEKRRLCEDQEPMVKRKLFSFERSSSLEMNDLKEETEAPDLSSQKLNGTHTTQKSSFLVDDDDFEISFKAAVKTENKSAAAQELDDIKSPLEVASIPDPTLGIEIGLFQKACLSSPDRIQLDFVPEKNSLEHSPSFKRSLSLSISEDDLAFPWKPLRKNSISFDPPRKSQKPSKHSKTLSSSVSSFNLQPHLAYRSSPRLSNIKSTSSLLSENLTTPKLGKICKKNDSLRKSAFRQSQSNGLSKAFSKVDLVEGLPKPGEELVQTISRNCLRSFRQFSVSPESKTPKPDSKPEMDEKPIETAEEIVPETPQNNTAPQCRGSNSSSKRSKKKGECGTRGLTPLNSKARFSLLKSYGILNIDKVEAEEIRNIRESREQCGCSCRGDCKPETCECAKNGIECQVERLGFPCKCGVGCKNPHGRKVFDEMEVSLHFINTMMNMKGVLDISGSEENLCQNQPTDQR